MPATARLTQMGLQTTNPVLVAPHTPMRTLNLLKTWYWVRRMQTGLKIKTVASTSQHWLRPQRSGLTLKPKLQHLARFKAIILTLASAVWRWPQAFSLNLEHLASFDTTGRMHRTNNHFMAIIQNNLC